MHDLTEDQIYNRDRGNDPNDDDAELICPVPDMRKWLDRAADHIG